jgi:hypothetical protein
MPQNKQERKPWYVEEFWDFWTGLPMDIATYKALVEEKDFEPMLELLKKVERYATEEAVRKCVDIRNQDRQMIKDLIASIGVGGNIMRDKDYIQGETLGKAIKKVDEYYAVSSLEALIK